MVKVTDYSARENKKGEQFYVLNLTGGMQIKKSASGHSYITSMSCSIPTSFNEEQCQSLIGQEIPGKIKKEQCEPYSYTVQSTGEVKELNYRYIYVDNTTEVIQENVVDEAEVI